VRPTNWARGGLLQESVSFAEGRSRLETLDDLADVSEPGFPPDRGPPLQGPQPEGKGRAACALDPFRPLKRRRRLAGCPYARTAGKQVRSGRASAKRVALHCRRPGGIGREGP